jgi:hypothetical protein
MPTGSEANQPQIDTTCSGKTKESKVLSTETLCRRYREHNNTEFVPCSVAVLHGIPVTAPGRAHRTVFVPHREYTKRSREVPFVVHKFRHAVDQIALSRDCLGIIVVMESSIEEEIMPFCAEFACHPSIFK